MNEDTNIVLLPNLMFQGVRDWSRPLLPDPDSLRRPSDRSQWRVQVRRKDVHKGFDRKRSLLSESGRTVLRRMWTRGLSWEHLDGLPPV